MAKHFGKNKHKENLNQGKETVRCIFVSTEIKLKLNAHLSWVENAPEEVAE